jgi:hypothetical protein
LQGGFDRVGAGGAVHALDQQDRLPHTRNVVRQGQSEIGLLDRIVQDKKVIFDRQRTAVVGKRRKDGTVHAIKVTPSH